MVQPALIMLTYCRGTFERNGAVVSDVVTAYFIGGSVRLGDNSQSLTRKTSLSLSPVDPRALTGPVLQPVLGKASRTLSDREWQVAGIHLGELEYGPFGHPADGEFEVRPVHAFTTRVAYSPHKLSLEFSGRTASGFEVCYSASKVEKLGLEPWDFRVRFDVERENLQAFFQLPDSGRDSFLAQLDQL